jgi:glycosyltransferase involved in cell wall biosynthesis
MRILIEHIITTPYTPERPYGGTERFCHQALLALRAAGHDARIFVPSDTDPLLEHTVNSGVPSTLCFAAGGRNFTDFRAWYVALEKAAVDYDYVIINSIFSSQALFKPWSFLRKSTLINHACFEGMIEGEGGMRFQLLGRWLQQNGGRCFSSGQSNIDQLSERWMTKIERIKAVYEDAIIENSINLNIPLFEGWVDVNVLPHDMAKFSKINRKKIVAVGRPVREKQILYAAKAMHELQGRGFDTHLFITDIGGDFDEIASMEGVTVHVNEPHHSIMSHIADARCLLFPSMSETNGIVAFEAAAHGVPVIHSCSEPEFFLQPAGLSRQFEYGSKRQLVRSLVELAVKENQTNDQRLEARCKFSAQNNATLADKLISMAPTGKPVRIPHWKPELPFRPLISLIANKASALTGLPVLLKWTMQPKALNPGEVNLSFGKINSHVTGIVRSTKSGIYVMLVNALSKDRQIRIGETVAVRVMAFDLPHIDGTFQPDIDRFAWGKWQCLWSGGTHTILDMGDGDMAAIAKLVAKAIRKCHAPILESVSKIRPVDLS